MKWCGFLFWFSDFVSIHFQDNIQIVIKNKIETRSKRLQQNLDMQSVICN